MRIREGLAGTPRSHHLSAQDCQLGIKRGATFIGWFAGAFGDIERFAYGSTARGLLVVLMHSAGTERQVFSAWRC